MIIKTVLDTGAKCPVKAHLSDAGYDLFSREDCCVKARSCAIFDTGVHMDIPDGYVGFLKSKSGLNVKHGIVSEGVIDAEYSGSIVVKLYNHSDTDYTVNCGDKITQIVILPIPDTEIDIVDEFEKKGRADGGFGSTGK